MISPTIFASFCLQGGISSQGKCCFDSYSMSFFVKMAAKSQTEGAPLLPVFLSLLTYKKGASVCRCNGPFYLALKHDLKEFHVT